MLEKSSVKMHVWLLCYRETDSQKAVAVRGSERQEGTNAPETGLPGRALPGTPRGSTRF